MIRIVKLSFEQAHIDDFKQFFETRKELIKNFDGCTHLELWQDHDNPCIFFTYSHWNQATNLETYRTSKLFQDTWATVKPWFSHKPEAFSANQLIEV
jgi:quinol monooxygenase YgiN